METRQHMEYKESVRYCEIVLDRLRSVVPALASQLVLTSPHVLQAVQAAQRRPEVTRALQGRTFALRGFLVVRSEWARNPAARANYVLALAERARHSAESK